MRSIFSTVAAIVALATSSLPALSDSPYVAVNDAVARAQEAARAPGLQFAVAKHGTIVDTADFGWADVAAHAKVTDSTVFALASCSKPITAMAVMSLVDANKVSLDTKVFGFLGLTAGNDKRIDSITLFELLNHSSGLPRTIAGASGDPSSAARLAAGATLAFDPGTKQVYSNLGFNVVGAVIEKASGESYASYVRAHVFAPAGVSDAAFIDKDAPIANQAVRYSGGRPVIDTQHDASSTPAGGWVLSASDMVKILSAYAAGKIDSQHSMDAMVAPPKSPLQPRSSGDAFGLGWDVVYRDSRGVFYGKNGGLDGARAWVEHRTDGTEVAVLYNGGNGTASHRPGLSGVEAALDGAR